MPLNPRLVTIPKPGDVGSLGAFRVATLTGTMVAGAAALSPWLSFRWTLATSVAVIRQVRVGLQSLTAFTAGNGRIDMIVARNFSASDVGGTTVTLTGNNQKMRTAMGTSGVGDFRIASTIALVAGIRTLDAQPLSILNFGINTTANSTQLASSSLFDLAPNEWPLILAANEGFVLRATVPATGTWNAFASVVWEENANLPF